MALCKAQGTLPERDRKRELHWKPTFDPSLEEWQDHNWPPTSRVLTNQWSVTCHQGSGYKGPRRLSHSVNSKCRSSTYLRSPRRWTHTHTHVRQTVSATKLRKCWGFFFWRCTAPQGDVAPSLLASQPYHQHRPLNAVVGCLKRFCFASSMTVQVFIVLKRRVTDMDLFWTILN